MRSFAFKNCVTPVDECLHKTADLNIFVSTITGKMVRCLVDDTRQKLHSWSDAHTHMRDSHRHRCLCTLPCV